MHEIQEKLLKLIDQQKLDCLSLREIGRKIGEPERPQKIKHHLDQLARKGFIKINKKSGKIEKIKTGSNNSANIISLPILGSANCGQAACFADNKVEGYLQISKRILGDFAKRSDDLFVLNAVGRSMNKANVEGSTIEDGDYIIVDSKQKKIKQGTYVVSVIGEVANIKKVFLDKKNNQIVLISESSRDIPPVYIHEKDIDDYVICGTVIRVMKKPDDLQPFQDAAAADTLKALGPMSDKEHDYYMNL